MQKRESVEREREKEVLREEEKTMDVCGMKTGGCGGVRDCSRAAWWEEEGISTETARERIAPACSLTAGVVQGALVNSCVQCFTPEAPPQYVFKKKKGKMKTSKALWRLL